MTPPPPNHHAADGPYTSTADAAQVAARLRAASSAIVLTHGKPDGDALGSTLAIVRALRARGATAEAWYVGPWPAWLETVANDTLPSFRKLSVDHAAPPPMEREPDAVVICDTGSWSQLDGVKSWLEPRTHRAILIDHHINGNASTAPMRLIETHAASATEVASSVIDELLNLKGGPFPKHIAEALFLGLATDTGWFRFSNVTPRTLTLASRLLASGVDHAALYEMTEQQSSLGRIKLLARALSSMKLHNSNSVAVLTLTRQDFQDAGANEEDTGGFGDQPMTIIGMRVVVVLTEMTKPGDPHPMTKASLRSKPGPDAVDVAAACATLGGGGHARAAGVKLRMPLSDARAAILKSLGVKS